MSARMFCFNPADYRDQFHRHGFVHIRNGVSPEFYERMRTQADEYMKSKLMKEFAIGDKQQAMYEFPPDGDYVSELVGSVAAISGLNEETLVLSERHIKAYEATADPNPRAHKDRYASQISVGLSIHVSDASRLVLFPYDETEVNPFNTSVGLRASLSPEQYPESRLATARRIEIHDAPGDVILFRGHSFWHFRSTPANTTMLYLKLNAFNCDPLGEDPRTPAAREATLAALELPDDQLEQRVPLIGRRVDYFHTYYSRDWREIPGVVLWGEKHFSLDPDEIEFARRSDGLSTIFSILRTNAFSVQRARMLDKIRRLASFGVIDLTASD